MEEGEKNNSIPSIVLSCPSSLFQNFHHLHYHIRSQSIEGTLNNLVFSKCAKLLNVFALNRFGFFGIIQTLGTDKQDQVERSIKDLTHKLSSAISECNAKDDLVTKHAKVAEEALAGWEKAESEAVSLKQDVERQREFMGHSDAALRECMQQLRFVREEQEQRVDDAVTKTSRQYEKVQLVLEEKLAETNKKLAKLSIEKTRLINTIQVKEKSGEELSRRNAELEKDVNALKSRLQSTEREDASMRYELRMLEKELEIRNQEREYNRRTADASQKQHLDNVKKIVKLENECQRLRVLIRKRLPGPAALAQMKSEVELLGKEATTETRRRNINPPMVKDLAKNSPNKRVNYLIERLCAMEEENKLLKDIISKKNNEIQSSRVTMSKLSDLSISPTKMELERNSPMSHGFSLEDDESWASALIFELDNFRNNKPKLGSDISLMDDFAEMEKSFESPHGCSVGSDALVVSPSQGFPVMDSPSGSSATNQVGKHPTWLQDILSIVVQQNRVTLTSPDEIIDHVTSALVHMNDSAPGAWKRSSFSTPSQSPHTNAWRSANDSPGMKDPASGMNILSKEITTQQFQSSLGKSISRIIELIQGINQQHHPGFMVRVFQWKSSELDHLLRQFVHTCTDLLNGKAHIEKFARELSLTFDWIMNHCFSVQDVSSMKDTIKKHFDWDETPSESGINGLYTEAEKQRATDDENRKLKDELTKLEAAKKDLQVKLYLATDKIENLVIQLKASGKSIDELQTQLDTLKASKHLIEDQIENQQLLNEDLASQITVGRVELDEARQKFSCLEVELEDKTNSCQELESTCLELQLQLESLTKKETPKLETEAKETGWEITAASEKLAECQETILKLGKQLKAMASPKEDKVISVTPCNKKQRQSSLLDKMLADDDDDDETQGFKSPQMKEMICTMDRRKPPTPLKTLERYMSSDEKSCKNDSTALAIVPSKKRGGGGGFLRKLLLRRKKGPLPPLVA